MRMVLAGASLIAAFSTLPTVAGKPDEVRRDIQEFIDAEHGCPAWLQNVDNVPFCEFRWWDPEDHLGVWIDYAGVANDLLGNPVPTEISGTITERVLDDGRAEVTIRIRTRQAITFAIPFDPAGPQTQFTQNPVYFGARPIDIVAGAMPTLGDAVHIIRFINPAPGAPIPALLPLFSFPEEGQELIEVVFQGSAAGELRAAFGLPDGTPGRLQATQTGLGMTRFRGATADAFPAEHVRLFVTSGTPEPP